MKKIVYIGNNLSEKSNYNSTMTTLSKLLSDEGYMLTCSSSKSNIIFRLLDMCITVIANRNRTDYILIDTFSTLNFYYTIIISQLARLFSIKYIPILHGGNLPLRLENSSFLSKLIFRNANIIIAPSKYLVSEFGKKNYKTVYIPNGISIKEYIYKKRIDLTPKLLWVRAFEKTYNPLLAIKVVELLRVHFKDVHLCMIGPDKDGSLQKAKELVAKLNLTKNVIFTGVLPKEQWHKLSEKFDIFINTTNTDNMPVSILEAMALGFPIVSTNVGGLPYLITDKEDGLLVPVNNEKMMVNSIIELIEDPNKAAKLSENARKKAENFDLLNIKKQWKTILI